MHKKSEKPQKNGLYTNCVNFNSQCRLSRGGAWRESENGTINPASQVYKEMALIHWKWGGELKATQKDFMHFSLSGD
jgi:hypothetical protein